MGKKITLDFLRGYQLGTRRESDPVAYQYDEGHTLEVKVPTSVTTAEIQYWIRGMDKAEAYTSGDITAESDGTYTITGNVPNSFFEHSGDLRVYVVVTDDSASVVTYEGYVHIVDRQMPEDYVDDDPENEATRVLIEAQEAAATATAAAETCQEVAESIPEDYSALSQDVNDLKADLSQAEDGKHTFTFCANWVNGGLSFVDSEHTTLSLNTSQSYRVTTLDEIVFDYDIVIKVKTGYKYVLLMKTAGVWHDRGWKTSDITIGAGQVFTVIIGKVTETTSVVGNIGEFTSALTINTRNTYDINTIQNDVTSMTFDATVKIHGTVEAGSYDSSGEFKDSTNNYRWTAKQETTGKIKAVIVADYRMAILYYDDNQTLISDSGWLASGTHIINLPFNAKYINVRLQAQSLAAVDLHVASSAFSVFNYMREPKAVNPVFHSLFQPAKSARWLFAKGKSWEALWNTREAYELAGQDSRCWGINGDCQYTSDDKFVMWHDTTITYNGSATAIRSLTYDQVRSIELTDGGQTYQVPSLDEFIQICRKYGKVCNIELKGPVAAWSWTANGKSSLIDEIATKLKNLGMQDSSFIDCAASDITYIRKYHNIACCRLWDSNVVASNINSLKDDPQIIQGGYATAWIEQDTMKIAHSAGQKCLVYTTRPQTSAILEQAISANGDIIGIMIDTDV